MTVFIKKALGSLLVLGILAFNLGVVETHSAERYGYISYYDGEGSKRSDSKILTKNDVAVSYADRYLPKGTPILTTNTTKNIKRTLYKWGLWFFWR